MSELFRGCSSLREVRFAKLRAPQATVIAALFEGCFKLRSVDLGDAYLPRLSHVGDNFEGCVALESWRLPAGWPARDSDLPKPTAPCGLWWAVDAQRWMDLAEIRQRLRDGIVDTYTSEPRESLS